MLLPGSLIQHACLQAAAESSRQAHAMRQQGTQQHIPLPPQPSRPAATHSLSQLLQASCQAREQGLGSAQPQACAAQHTLSRQAAAHGLPAVTLEVCHLLGPSEEQSLAQVAPMVAVSALILVCQPIAHSSGWSSAFCCCRRAC